MPDNNGVEYTSPPQSRNEAILDDTLNGVQYTDPPQSRIEALLKTLNALIISGGGSPNVINLKSLGAAGDGETDDSDAVKDAFDLAIETGMPLYIPEGVYMVKWGYIKPFVGEKGIAILGDGKYKSILRFNENHLNDDGQQNGNGVVLQNQYTSTTKPNVSISNIGLCYDNDRSVLNPDKQASLLNIYAQFGKVTIENCYFHLGGTAENKPADSCVFVALGADIFSFKNNVVENFTNNVHGAGLWIMTDYRDYQEHLYNYKIDTVVVEDNEFLTSNSDEALGLYPSYGNDNPGQIFDHVYISNNVFIHKNWLNAEGAVKTTYGIVTIFVYHDAAPVINADIFVTNNYIESALAFQELIRVTGFTGVDVSNNHLVLKAHSLTGQNPQLTLLLFGRDTKGIVKDNYFDYAAITCEVRIVESKTSEGLWKGNTIITGGKFALNPGGSNAQDHWAGGKLIFEENNVFIPNGSLFVVRKVYHLATIIMYNNNIYGNLNLGAIIGGGLIIRGNRFNAHNGADNNVNVSTETDIEDAELDFQLNEGATLNLITTNVVEKIAKFKYTGKKKNLVFKNGNTTVEDSAETRALFFASTANTDITYFGTT